MKWKAVIALHRDPALFTGLAFAGINAIFWVWCFHLPEFRQENLGMEAGMGVFFVSMFIMGPGTLLFLIHACLYSALFHASLVGVMPKLASDALMILSGLIGWGVTGFIITKGIASIMKTRARRKAGANGPKVRVWRESALGFSILFALIIFGAICLAHACQHPPI